MEEKKLTDDVRTFVALFVEFDEMGFAPTTTCPNPEEHAKAWKMAMLNKVHRLQSENADLREENEAIRINCENARNITGQMFDKNDELQKQVDELKFFEKKYNDLAKKYMADTKTADFIRHHAEKDTAKEVLQMLHDIGGCDATDEWSKGWDKAIDTAYEAVKKRYGVEVE